MTEISEPVRAFLDLPHVGVLATVNRGGRPQATPVWFMLDDGHILINTSRGRAKLRNVRANPNVALTVVDPQNPYRYVEIQGRVARIDPTAGSRDIDRLSMRYRGRDYQYPPTDAPERRVSLLIKPERITAALR